VRTLPGHEYLALRFAFSADGRWLVSAEMLQRRVLLWSTTGWQQPPIVVDALKGASFSQVSRDLEHVMMRVSAGAAPPAFFSLRLQATERDSTISAITTPAAPSPGVLLYSPDAGRVAVLQTAFVDRRDGTAAGRYRVTVLDRRTGAPLRTFGLPLPPGPAITDQSALSKFKITERVTGTRMEWSLDGRVLFVTRSDARTDPSCHGEVWDASRGTLLHQFDVAAPPAFGCQTMSLTPDGSGVLQMLQPWDSPARKALTPRLVDLRSGRVLWTAPGIESFPTEFGAIPVFSRDGRAAALAAFDGGIDILDVRTGARIARLPAIATSMAFSPDGRRIATVTTQGNVRLWDAVSGRPLLTLPDAPGAYRTTTWDLPGSAQSSGLAGVAFSADGSELIVLMRIRTTTASGTQTRLERRVWDGAAITSAR